MDTIQTLKQQAKDLSRSILNIGNEIADKPHLSWELTDRRQSLVLERKRVCEALEKQTHRDWYTHLRESLLP